MERIEDLREEIQKLKADSFLVSHLPNIFYLTGFTGSNGLLLVKKEAVYFFTDFRYKEQARDEISQGIETIIVTDLFEELPKVIERGERVCIEGEFISYSKFKKLEEILKEVKIIPVENVVIRLRAKKKPSELEKIRRAQKIVDEVFKEIVEMIKPDRMTEADLALEIDYMTRKKGSQKPPFETIVASGPHSALPHAKPRNEKIKKGTMLLIDFGATFEGYSSDMTRTLWIGTLHEKKFIHMYNSVLEAQRIAEEAVKAGMKAKELHELAKKILDGKGYSKEFGHGLGHGVGIEVHENPTLSLRSKDTLEVGNVLTIEPGVYIPGFGGVRIEDMVYIGEGGGEILTTSPKDLIIL